MPWRIVELPEGMARTRYQTIPRLFPTQESAAAHRVAPSMIQMGSCLHSLRPKTDEVKARRLLRRCWFIAPSCGPLLCFKFQNDSDHRLFQFSQQMFVHAKVGGTHGGHRIASKRVGIKLRFIEPDA
jgi:hypothetical protein